MVDPDMHDTSHTRHERCRCFTTQPLSATQRGFSCSRTMLYSCNTALPLDAYTSTTLVCLCHSLLTCSFCFKLWPYRDAAGSFNLP